METTQRTVSRQQLRQQIERWRDNLIDFEIVVDDARHDVDAAVERLQSAVRERDRAALQLQKMIEWHDELPARIEVFGLETVVHHIAMLSEARG